MYIKRINNVVGYKGLPDGFNADFSDNVTYIVGGNFQGKTTVGSLFNWCLTGTTLSGKEKEQVANDNKKNKNVIVDITFIDNYGIEHRITRERGKEMNLTLDGREVKQEMLAQFYKEKDIFLVAYNPYYFFSLEPKEQKDLLRKIVPVISPEEAFSFLNKYEQEKIGEPIDNLSTYTENRNEELNQLQKEYDRNTGSLQAYSEIALKQEGDILKFEKEEELKELQERYEIISRDFDNSNLEDLKKNINRINEKLTEIFQVKLVEITEKYNRENKKLENLNKEKSICLSCRQEIKDEDALKHLKNFQIKELERLQEKANKLKDEFKQLTNEKNKKSEILKRISTSEMQDISNERQQIKTRIEILQEEKNNILLHNREVEIKREQIKNAKENINLIEETQANILQQIQANKIKKDIANKLKILVIEAQKKEIAKYLNKVEIQFSELKKSTGQIAECCNIQYEGRDYKKLSKSQQARAALEISNVFNNLSGIKTPIFFDDSESTTNIEKIENTQMIISLVIKDTPLDILHNYEDVLDMRQKSLQKEKEESSTISLQEAA